jgi:membrane-associated HD superfamily phosphohydrolase
MLNEDYILATDVMILVQLRLVSRYLGINCLLHSNGFSLFIVDIFCAKGRTRHSISILRESVLFFFLLFFEKLALFVTHRYVVSQ